MVTKSELMRLFPTAAPKLVDAVISNWDEAEQAGITTPLRIRNFLANIGVETGGLTSISESLTYTSAQRIYDMFKGPSSNPRFKSVAECKPYVKQAKKLAIKVYGGRMGNRPAPSTDGYDFRGGGMLQTTGADGYEAVGYKENPDILRSDAVAAFKVAVREWDRRGCNKLADKDDERGCRKAINGGTNGMDILIPYLSKASRIWPDDVKPVKYSPTPITEDLYDGKFHEEVKTVQTRLDELGYHEIGTLDGKWGTRTAGSITTFQGDNGLELDPKISPELLAALMTAKPRVIDAARANTTIKDLRKEDVPEIKQNDQSKAAGYVGLGLAGFTGGTKVLDDAKGTSETLRSIWDTLEPVQSFLINNLWIFLGAGGLFVIWKSGLLQKLRLQKHQDGSDVSA